MSRKRKVESADETTSLMEGNKPDSPEPVRKPPPRSHFGLYMFSHVVMLVIIVLIVVWVEKYSGKSSGFGYEDPGMEFNFHPFFMVLGLVYFYGNAILIYRVLSHQPKNLLKLVHGGLNSAALIFTILGLFFVIDFHNRANIPNFYSLHSWIGITTAVCFALQLVGGAVVFLVPQTPVAIRSMVLPLHVYGGVLMFAMSIASCWTGLTEKALFTMGAGSAEPYSKLPTPGKLINAIGVLLLVYGIIVAYLVTDERFKRRPLPEEAPVQYRMTRSNSNLARE